MWDSRAAILTNPGSERRGGVCAGVYVCVRKVFCKHLILHNECSPLSSLPSCAHTHIDISAHAHTHTPATNHYARELPLPVKLTLLPSPHTSPSVHVWLCVCVIDRADSVVFLTGKQEVPSVIICILCVWGSESAPPPPSKVVCAMFRSTQGVLFGWFWLAHREC